MAPLLAGPRMFLAKKKNINAIINKSTKTGFIELRIVITQIRVPTAIIGVSAAITERLREGMVTSEKLELKKMTAQTVNRSNISAPVSAG